MNYYDILEVSPNASAEVIRAAYKSLMQRYHPDKNPGDSAIAERASLVVQAYEVLSNVEQRSRYDLQLQVLAGTGKVARGGRSPSGPVRVSGKKENSYFWILCLLILAILCAGWAVTAFLKKRLPQETTPSDSLAKFSAPAKPPLLAKEVPVLVAGLSIHLKNPENPEEDSGHILNIPAVGVRVGTQDSENAIRHLSKTKDAIAQKMREKLVTAKYEELIKASGEKYLAKMLLDIISDSAGTGHAAIQGNGSDATDAYGAVAVLLPESFSVK